MYELTVLWRSRARVWLARNQPIGPIAHDPPLSCESTGEQCKAQYIMEALRKLIYTKKSAHSSIHPHGNSSSIRSSSSSSLLSKPLVKSSSTVFSLAATQATNKRSSDLNLQQVDSDLSFSSDFSTIESLGQSHESQYHLSNWLKWHSLEGSHLDEELVNSLFEDFLVNYSPISPLLTLFM